MFNFNLRGYENHAEDSSESRMFWQLFEEFFIQQFVAQLIRHGAILDLVLSDNWSLVTEVKMCEGLGYSNHHKVMLSIALEIKQRTIILWCLTSITVGHTGHFSNVSIFGNFSKNSNICISFLVMLSKW